MIEDFFKIIKDVKADEYLAWNDKVQTEIAKRYKELIDLLVDNKAT